MSFLDFGEFVSVERDGKEIIARFTGPTRVIISDGRGGGIREDLEACYDHQICEAHGAGHLSLDGQSLAQLHQQRCARHGLDPRRTIGLGTAANMRCAGLGKASFQGLEVAAICTAGVATNAMRAGDRAGFHERNGEIELLDSSTPPAGTIILMIFVNQQLSPGALTRAVMTATEAKSAALADLLVGSNYGPGIATGTGSDEIMIGCPILAGPPLTQAGGHAKLGELVAQSVAGAMGQALLLQNSLAPNSQAAVSRQLARFGLTSASIANSARQWLDDSTADFLTANLAAIDRDPFVVAAAAGLATIADQLASGILPAEVSADLAERAGAVLAQSVALGEGDLEHFRTQLKGSEFELGDLVPRAIALGFSYRWRRLDAVLERCKD